MSVCSKSFGKTAFGQAQLSHNCLHMPYIPESHQLAEMDSTQDDIRPLFLLDSYTLINFQVWIKIFLSERSSTDSTFILYKPAAGYATLCRCAGLSDHSLVAYAIMCSYPVGLKVYLMSEQSSTSKLLCMLAAG